MLLRLKTQKFEGLPSWEIDFLRHFSGNLWQMPVTCSSLDYPYDPSLGLIGVILSGLWQIELENCHFYFINSQNGEIFAAPNQ